jgi:phosphotriesterase-related protein
MDQPREEINIMAIIRTVMGDINPEDIGITLIHEHIYTLDAEIQTSELLEFKEQGGNCVVDQTTIGLNRRPHLLKSIAGKTGLHIIASTGYYREERHPEFLFQYQVDDIAQVMINEIDDHIEGTDFKAGLIGELGTTEFGTTDQEDKILRAAAKAHLATGVTISVHTMGGAEALHAIQVLQDQGADPSHLIIDHIDLDNFEHLCLIAKTGAFLGFDTIGKSRYRDDTVRLHLLVEMVKEGYEDQIVLSHDISKLDYLKTKGGHGYVHLLSTFIPNLRKYLYEEIITKFLVHNPRRALAF